MYDVSASRYVSRHVPVSPCDSAEGVVFMEVPATNRVHCIHYHSCLQILLWQIRNSAYTCLFSHDFNRTGICSCRSHCSIFIEKWRRGLAAFVISDEIHYVDFTTISNNVCHSHEVCNFITYPRTDRLMFRLRSTCILVFMYSVGQRVWSSDIESACKPSSFTWMRLSFRSLSVQCPFDMLIRFIVKVFISMAAFTLTTSLNHLSHTLDLTRNVDCESGNATLIWCDTGCSDDNMKPVRNFLNTHG